MIRFHRLHGGSSALVNARCRARGLVAPRTLARRMALPPSRHGQTGAPGVAAPSRTLVHLGRSPRPCAATPAGGRDVSSDRDGFGGSDRQRSGQLPARAGHGCRGRRQRHAGLLLRPRGSTTWNRDRLAEALPALHAGRPRRPRCRGHRPARSAGTARRSSWSSTPPRSRATIGRPASRSPTSTSTPTARSTCWRPPAVLPRGGLHLHFDQQGLRRHAQRAAAGREPKRAGRSTRPPLRRARHRRDDAHRPVASTACSAPARSPPT